MDIEKLLKKGMDELQEYVESFQHMKYIDDKNFYKKNKKDVEQLKRTHKTVKRLVDDCIYMVEQLSMKAYNDQEKLNEIKKDI